MSGAAAVLGAARDCVRELAAYVPGARPARPDERVCRLASNENPLGCGAAARAALAGLGGLGRYPDNDGRALRELLAAAHGCPPECLLLGNGSSDLLDLAARVWLEPGRNAVFAEHAFVIYPLAVRAQDAEARAAPARPPDDAQPLGHDAAALAAAADDATAMLFVANPNNPTGTLLGDGELRELLAALPPRTAVVLDEAYAEYRDPVPAAARFLDDPRVIVTRTFSKIHGLAGLRIGYAVAHPEVVALLNRVRQPFNVNAAAQCAAAAALGDAAHLERSRAANAAGRERLREAAERLELPALGAHANFLTLRFGADAAAARAFLAERNILVRALPEYGLPDWLRATIGDAAETAALIAALEAWRCA